jgi:hypothetical protein
VKRPGAGKSLTIDHRSILGGNVDQFSGQIAMDDNGAMPARNGFIVENDIVVGKTAHAVKPDIQRQLPAAEQEPTNNPGGTFEHSGEMSLILGIARLDADAAQHCQFAKGALNPLPRLAEFFAAGGRFKMDTLQPWIYHAFTMVS